MDRKASRELDTLIWEKVFGKVVEPSDPTSNAPRFTRMQHSTYGLMSFIDKRYFCNKPGDDEPTAFHIGGCPSIGWEVDIVLCHHDGPLELAGSKGKNLSITIVNAIIDYLEGMVWMHTLEEHIYNSDLPPVDERAIETIVLDGDNHPDFPL